jgi:tetratricopeptide (TPR) repeat protein
MLSKQPLPISSSSLEVLLDQPVLAISLQQKEFLQRNAEKLVSIELFAELSVGFTIAFMEVNTDRDRQIVIEYLQNSDRFPHVQWIPIALADENLQYFGLEVREKLQSIALNSDRQTVLLISGLERSIGAFGEYPAVLSNLNMERDSYPHLLPYPIVLLLPSYAINRCARYAPDFWSWKSIDVQLQSETPTPEVSPQIKPIATDSTTVKPASQSRFDLLKQLLTENLEPTIDRARLLNQLGDAYCSIYENDQAEASYRSALAIYDNLPASLDRAKTMDGLAKLYDLQGKYSAALQLWQQALAVQQEIGDRQGEAVSLHQMSIIYKTLGDLPQALHLSEQSIKIKKEIGNRQGEAASLHQMSIIYQTVGDLQKALHLSEQSIEIQREIGNRQGEAASLHQMSIIYETLGELQKALHLSEQSIEIQREIGNRQGEAGSLHQMSMIYKILGDLQKALHFSEQSIEIQREIGNRQGEAASLHQMSIIYKTLGELQKALHLSEQSIKIKKEIGDRQGEAGSLHQMSMIYKTLGDLQKALNLSEQSIEICKEIGDRQGEAASLHQMSIIYEKLGDLQKTLNLSDQSIEIDREIGNRQGEAASLAQMAAIAYQQGDVALERELRLQAVAIRSMIGDYGGLIITLRNLGTDDEPEALGYLAQSLWLTINLSPNLEKAITLIQLIYQKVPAGDRIESLLGATAIYLCHNYQHPELEKLTELSDNIISHAAQQQGIATQADYDNWKTKNRLNDPDYFLPELLKELAAIVGDNWLFDRAAFLARNRSSE